MKKLAALFASVLLMASAAADDGILQPKVSFSAWRVMSGTELTIEGPYYYAHGKHRHEMEVEGERMTGIFREDLQVLWSVLPNERIYMEFALDSPSSRAPGSGFDGAELLEHRVIGTERIGGQRTTRYEVLIRPPMGGTASGTVWVTGDSIPVKMDMAAEGERVVIELKDIQVGPQPDHLFEIPAGYTQLSLGPLGELGGSLERLGALARGSRERGGRAQEEPGFGQEIAEEALDGAREGTKRGVRQGVEQNVTRRIRGIFRNR